MNAINVIYPEYHNGIWVFTDESKELVNEPFVGATNSVISLIANVAGVLNNDKFRLLFSSISFPEYQHVVTHIENKVSDFGDWYDFEIYLDEVFSYQFWLCPALLKYFDTAPDEIYIKCESLNENNNNC